MKNQLFVTPTPTPTPTPTTTAMELLPEVDDYDEARLLLVSRNLHLVDPHPFLTNCPPPSNPESDGIIHFRGEIYSTLKSNNQKDKKVT